jgi:hypothetical protein
MLDSKESIVEQENDCWEGGKEEVLEAAGVAGDWSYGIGLSFGVLATEETLEK